MTSDPYSPQPAPRQRGWWSRNWLWVVPVGCLIPLVVCCGGGTIAIMFGFRVIKSTDVYQEAMAKARANDQVKAALGEPIEDGWMIQGSVNVNDNSGTADMTIPISGPQGSGNIHVAGQKAGGKWEYSKMEVTIAGRLGPPINLLKKE